MRLKNILREQTNKEEVKKLAKLLGSNYKGMGLKNLLWRATDRDISTWKELSIRKDRKPVDSSLRSQMIIDAISSNNFHPNFPKRSESKFASSIDYKSSEYLKNYGSNVYITFPHKKAKVVAWYEDSFVYTHSINVKMQSIKYLRRDVDKFQSYDYFVKLIKAYRESVYGSNKQLFELMKNSYDKVKEDVFQIYEENWSDEIRNIIDNVVEGFETIEDYFDEAFVGLESMDGLSLQEIMFDGPNYIAVNQQFFKKNFSWNGDRWRVKDEV